MLKLIAFLAYEIPQFPCGGIAAVMGRLPAAVRQVSNSAVLIITPFHVSSHQNNKIPSLSVIPIGNDSVKYQDSWVPVTIYRHTNEIGWYFLRPDDGFSPGEKPFFAGERHPYDLDARTLLRDSLFFGAAVVQVLSTIEKDILHDLQTKSAVDVEWRLVLQDWETATAALAAATQGMTNVVLHLTLHNSYDAFAPPSDWAVSNERLARPGLARVGIDDTRCAGDTILDRAFSLVQWPVFTVSKQFAAEFTDDLLQHAVMAPQLQEVLTRRRVLGVDNGPFKDLAVPKDILNKAASGAFGDLHRWKSENRVNALQALNAHVPTDKEPIWGNKAKFRQGDAPWFVMAGRDDPRQKGYDVAAAAIEDYLTESKSKPDRAQFLFFPIPGDEDLPGLQFLQDLAQQFPQDVLVFPFRWAAGFSAALRSAAYGLMPSLYEPFGMANEFYLDGGCVGIGRATGGTVEQIVPLWAARACSTAVCSRAAPFHSMSSHPTGILFRERDDIPTALDDWKGINDTNYNKHGGPPTRVQERGEYPLFKAMAAELRIAIEDGIRIFTREPELYYRMLVEGIVHIQRTFSWYRAAQEYVRYLT